MDLRSIQISRVATINDVLLAEEMGRNKIRGWSQYLGNTFERCPATCKHLAARRLILKTGDIMHSDIVMGLKRLFAVGICLVPR